jgi:hypothetical protein
VRACGAVAPIALTAISNLAPPKAVEHHRLFAVAQYAARSAVRGSASALGEALLLGDNGAA